MEKVDRSLGRRLRDINAFIETVYQHDLHAKRVASLAGATLEVMASASLAVAMIGQGLAQACGLVTKHAIKQVDRLGCDNELWPTCADEFWPTSGC